MHEPKYIIEKIYPDEYYKARDYPLKMIEQLRADFEKRCQPYMAMLRTIENIYVPTRIVIREI